MYGFLLARTYSISSLLPERVLDTLNNQSPSYDMSLDRGTPPWSMM